MTKKLLLRFLGFYQRWLSPDRGVIAPLVSRRFGCPMEPTCSAYMVAAVEKYGAARGLVKGVRRVLRCHPFQKELVDHP